MQRILLFFGWALIASVVFNHPCAFAQAGDPTVDESISAILDGPGEAVVVKAPTVEPAKPVAPVVAKAPAVVVVVNEAPAAEAVVEKAPAVEAPVVSVVVEAAPAVEAVEPVVAVVEETAPVVEAKEPVVAVVDEKADAVEEVVPAVAEVSPVVAPAAAEVPAEVAGADLVVLTGGNGAQNAKSANGLVSMAFEEETLPNVVKAFRDATGANIISGWTNAATRLVSARLDNVEWQMGLNAIVASYGLELKEEPRDSSIYIVREKVTVTSEQPRFAETFVLKHAKAADVSSILQYSLGFAAPAVEATNKISKAKSSAVTDPKSVTVAFPSANIVVVKATEEQLLASRNIIAELDVPTRQVYIEARFVRLSSSAGKKLGVKWDALSEFSANMQLGGGFQVSDGTVATHDVTGTTAKRLTKVSKTGVKTKSDWAQTDTTTTLIPSTYEDLPDTTISGLTAGDMSWKKASAFGGVLSMSELGLTLSAFEKIEGAQMFSNPRIIVENETTAKVDMTVKEPNVEIEVTSGTQDSPGDKISSKLAKIPGTKEPWVGEAFFSYGITLEVTPRVSTTGLITVDILPSISALDYSSGENGYRFIGAVDGVQNQYPIIRMQRLETTFTMADGKTAVIGGLTETTEGTIDSGIPLLRKIPWIGPRLFGWKSRQKTQYEIIVFVSVGIIDGTTIEQNAGMPKNAVLGRGLFDGSIKEPGDRSDEEMFDLERKPDRAYRIK